MNPELLKKLRLPPGVRALVLNAPQGYLENLGAEVHTAPDGAGSYDFVQVFAKDSTEYFNLTPGAIQSVAFDGLFWVCYPKKSGSIQSDLSRDLIPPLMDSIGSGMRPVTQIALDETWSALRFRPTSQVGR